MTINVIPPGPQVPPELRSILQSYYQAIIQLQSPGLPVSLHNVSLKTDLPTASDWPEKAIICDEINSICVSTKVSGSYAWRRADGSAL